MGQTTNRKPYPTELRERAVRMVPEHEGEYASRWAALTSIAEKFGCNPETLRGWLHQADRDALEQALHARQPGKDQKTSFIIAIAASSTCR